MKEEEIRPEQLMLENFELRSEDIKLLLHQKEKFCNVPCPACESDNYKFVFEKEGFTFVICKECETLFINPRPTFTMIRKFYETSKCMKHWNKIFSVTEESRRNEIFAPRVERVMELCKKNNSKGGVLLDVGAGFGTFCEEITKKGFFDKVIAVEPSHELAEACRHKGLNVIQEPIEKIKLDEVNVITSFELIEHLFYPRDFLISCARALSKNGLLILTTPNIKGFDLLILNMLSDNIAGPNHLNYFHPKSLTKLLQECGLNVIEVLTPGKLDAEIVRKKILAGQLDISNQPFLNHILIEKWETLGYAIQRFLADNGLSSHMWVVAKK